MSRLDGLYAMASQDVSPQERDIARAKLEAMGAWPPPPRPPAPSASPSPDESHRWTTTGSMFYGGNVAYSGTFTFTFTTAADNR